MEKNSKFLFSGVLSKLWGVAKFRSFMLMQSNLYKY